MGIVEVPSLYCKYSNLVLIWRLMTNFPCLACRLQFLGHLLSPIDCNIIGYTKSTKIFNELIIIFEVIKIKLTWKTTKFGVAGVTATTQTHNTISLARNLEYPPFNGQIIPLYRSKAIMTKVNMLAFIHKCWKGKKYFRYSTRIWLFN